MGSVQWRQGALGTEVLVEYPWGTFHKAKLMCSDGKVRSTNRMALTADTMFSVPCSVSMWDKAAGKNVSVSGFMTCSSVTGSDVVTEDDPLVYKFVSYKYGKNGHLLPGLAWKQQHSAYGLAAPADIIVGRPAS